MRRLWLALFLVLTLVPAAAADEGRPRPAQSHQEMHQDDGSTPADLARSVGGAELLVAVDGRGRDLGGRGFTGKLPGTHLPAARSIQLSRGILTSPTIHPAPSAAETLPYHATAPPVTA